MSVLAFFENERQQIRNVVDYANHNIYQLNDILDMMNNEKVTPSEIPEHLVLVGIGRWICYFLVDHPNKGRCHYFQIKPDAYGRLPEKDEMEYILTEFGIESLLLDMHITIDEKNEAIKIILPFNNKYRAS
jgi:hypothetical protein